MKMRRSCAVSPTRLAILALLFVSTVGCGGGDTGVSEARPISALPDGVGGPDDMASRLGFSRPTPRPQQPTANAAPPSFDYELPDGWREIEPAQFRQINLKIDSAAASEAYVSILAGAGGGIAGNIDRWRGQMGLPPFTPEQRRELPVVEIGGRPGLLLDFEGTFTGMGGPERKDYRLLGAIFEEAGHGVFIKLVGPKAEVEAERARFSEFISSMVAKNTDPHAGHNHAQPGGAFDPRSLEWTAPEGWVKGADRNMRSVTYHPAGDKKMDCSIIILPGEAGGLVPNVNRWLGQVGRPPLTGAQVEELEKVTILGHPSPLVDATGSFRGMSGPEQEGAALLGAICSLGSHSIYVKLTGPKALVDGERENFLAFCQSLR